jgi:hypothetical protein
VAGVALAAARPEVPRQTAVAHAAALPSRELHRKLHRDPKRGTRPFFKGWVKVVKYFGYLIHENSLKLGVLRYISPQKKTGFNGDLTTKNCFGGGSHHSILGDLFVSSISQS